MIVLADQPFVTSATFDALIDGYRRTRASVVLPTYHGFRGNPVIVDRALFAEMMGIRGDVGCRSIFGDHAESIVKVEVDDRGVVTDIDTPEDLERGVAESQGREVAALRGDTGPPRDPETPRPRDPRADLLETIVDLRRRRQPFAMATVVRAERPTSSKPATKRSSRRTER